MSKVVCYTKQCLPEEYDESTWYFELFSIPAERYDNVGYVGNGFFQELKRSKITPSNKALDFVMISMSVVAADKAILRRYSPDGWTRRIELEIPLQNAEEWDKVKEKLEKMLRFLSGDFWRLTFTKLSKNIDMGNFKEGKDKNCVCLLSGGMDSLVGGIDLCEAGEKPLFVAQTVRGDAVHQRQYANALGEDNLCQWSCYISKRGMSENTTRARSIVFFAFALLASFGVSANEQGKKTIYVPENGFISLNIPLDILRSGSLSTKTTHPIYMKALQEIWDEMGFNVDFVLPYQYKTKGEVLLECKNQSLMRSLIMGTTSCGKYTRHGYRHCGVCIPCLVRRASFMKAHISDETEGGYCIENIKMTTSRDVAAAALGVTQYEKHGIESLIKGELNFVSGEERKKYAEVFERGLCEIRDILRIGEVV